MQKESEKRFKEINEAYHILSNAKKREQYDVAGDENFDSSQARGGPSSMAYRRTPGGSAGPFPGGAFRSGQWTTFSGSSRPQRSGYTQFETMFDGGIGGVGGNFDSDSILGMLFQNMFNGASGGARGRPQRHPFGGQEPVDPPVVEKELFCSLEEVFSGCKKTLRLKDVVLGRPVQRDVVVEVRPGWKAGTRITFKATSSFPVAIVFVLKIRDHAYLQRRGDDLVWKCSLTSGQVAKGVSIKVPMIDGTTVVYNTTETDTPILSGHKRVFPNLGMPISKLSIVDQAHKRTRGDFILEFEVRNN
jgi:DnaJ family protein B protein 4